MEILIDTILLDLDEDEESLPLKVMKVLSLERPVPVRIIRKSLDARNKKHIHYRYRVIAAIDDRDSERLLGLPGVSPAARDTEPVRVPAALKGARIAVIGSGPAGIFCAMRLIEHGAEVHVFERGKPVEDRIRDIHALENHGVLNRESNVLFGEGGAGTYSDGKLTARTKRPEAGVLQARGHGSSRVNPLRRQAPPRYRHARRHHQEHPHLYTFRGIFHSLQRTHGRSHHTGRCGKRLCNVSGPGAPV